QTLELLCDSKVEQADCAVAFDEDIRRLEVTVDDCLSMRVLHCLTNGTKQMEALLDRALVLIVIICERHSFDILHDEPWSAVRKRVGVVQACDRRMIELSQGSLLAGETFATSRREP